MAKKRINANQKGKRGERGARDWLKSLGFGEARRTQQYNGKGDSDVVVLEGLPNLHIEVKFWSSFNGTKIRAAVMQALNDSKGKPFCVIWRCTQGKVARDWRIVFLQGNTMMVQLPDDLDKCKRRLELLNAAV